MRRGRSAREMKHLGDITKINGAEIEPVDVITGGSPCQDLSVAGKRAGLAGTRSGLFMEQIRIVKEMRQADEQAGRTGGFIRPRYLIWENVPGAFSSNKGKDFAAARTARAIRPAATRSRCRFGTFWQSASARSICAPLRWAACLMASADSRWYSSGTTARGRRAGRARLKSSPLP